MAINQNHTVEELNGIRCAVVEKNVDAARAEFLKSLLEYNGYHVEMMPTPVKTSPPAEGEPAEAAPETFTVGVTDLSYNTINAIFGRLLHTRNGHVVTLAYWQQREEISRDDLPYFEDL